MEDVRARFTLRNENPIACKFIINARGTNWGSIIGNIENQTDLQDALDAKQDVLTAGDNITIENNVISATDTTYTAGTGISIENGVISNTQTSAEWGNITGTLSDQTDLQNALDGLSGDITDITNTMDNYGDIVTYNAADFATKNQGELADTALQPNDNISELVNNVGYITSASLPTVNNATITIQKNGSTVESFTLNQSNNETVNITVPTTASDVGALPDTTTINDLTTTAQQNALNSGATSANIGQIATNTGAIADINDLIPSAASTSNQLADKDFVNSSVATNTANFIGTFNSVAELEAYSGPLTNNDYAFVVTTDAEGNTYYDRYKYTDATNPPSWEFEYELNNSSFTSTQWAAINSGITSADVTLIGTALQPNDNISELTNDAGYITSASLPTVNNATLTIQKNGSNVATFTANSATNQTANITVPTDTSELTNNAGYITGINSSDVTTALGYTPVNPSSLATVATSGSYNDLSNTPTIPTVGDGTITFTQGGVTKGTITTNQSGDTTIDLDAVGGDVTDVQVDGVSVLDGTVAKIDLSGKQDVLTSANAGTDISIEEPIVDVTTTGNGSVTIETTEISELNSVTAIGKLQQGILPQGYTEYEWIQNNASTYIKTGFTDDTDDLEFEIKVRPNTGSWYIFQSRVSSGGTIVGIAGAQSGAKIQAGAWGKTVVSSISRDVSHTYIVRVTTKNGNVTLYVKDETANTEDTQTSTYTYNPTGEEFCIWGNTNGDKVASGNKVYYAKLKKDGVLVLDYVPASYDGTKGFYDKVTKTFKTVDIGSIASTTGSEITPTPTAPIDITCNNGVLGLSPDIFNSSAINWSTTSVIVYSPLQVGDGTFTLSTPDYLDDSTYTNMFFLAGNVSTGASSTNNGVYKGKTVTQTAVDGYVTIATRAITSGREMGDPKDYTWYLRKTNEYSVTGTTETITDSLSNSATIQNLLEITDTYKDTQEVLTGAVTRKCKVVVFDGSENWSVANSACYLPIGIDGMANEGLNAYCTHFIYDNNKHSTSGMVDNTFLFNWSGTQTATNGTVTIKATSLFTTVPQVKAWLANQYANGTPVIMVVPIPTETTETVSGQGMGIKLGTNTFTASGSLPNLPITIGHSEVSDTVISFTNDTGYITGIDSTDVTTALGYTPYDSANPNGYTSNTGTVTSVNNVSPVSGDVTLTASDVGAEPTLGYTPVNKAGDTMTGILKIQRDSGNEFLQIYPNVQLTTPPASTRNMSMLVNYDTNSKVMAKAMQVLGSDGSNSVKLSAFHPNGGGSVAGMEAGWDSNGIAYASCAETSSNRNNSGDIITRGYLNTQLSGKENALGYTPADEDLSNLSAAGQGVLNDKADTDLSNLTSTSSTNFDGQWVYSYLGVASNVNVPIGTNVSLANYSLATYLPDDNYNYEVSVYMSVVTGATSGSYCHCWAYGQNDIVGGGAGGTTRTASTMTYPGRGIVIIGSDRKIYVNASTTVAAGTLQSLQLNGYRRIGTNS